MHDLKTLARLLGAVSAALLTGACADGTIGSSDEAAPTGTMISNPSTAVSFGGSGGVITVSGASGGIVFLSLEPGTLPTAERIRIYNRTQKGPSTLVPLKDGGFDPVPIKGKPDDVIRMDVVLAGGIVRPMTIRVPARRNPRVVRTSPSKGRIDIALNVMVNVVFTEPVDPSTVSDSSFTLLRNGQPVEGTLTVASNGLSAEFVPEVLLAPQSEYSLRVSQDVHDLDGDPLDAVETVSFTTGRQAAGTCPGYADPTRCPPFPTGGPYAIDGVVTEHREDGDVRVANPTVFAWVQRSQNGYARGATAGDAQGRFRIDQLPSALVVLTAASAMDQPCAATVNIAGANATTSIELISPETPMPARAVLPPVVTGIVYELVDGVRRPVPGARVYFDAAMDLIVALTTTDDNGRYALCNLPAIWTTQTIWVSSPAFQLAEQPVSISNTVTELDIELKR